jgi:hypothetical protein
MNKHPLTQQIVNAFADKWEMNDPAHRQGHFETVYQTGLVINQQLDLGFDPKLILFAAYFHDFFAWSRNNHHELAFHWMSTTDHPVILENLSPSETMLVAWGCGQHRASFKGSFKNTFCELINSADREFPGNIDHMIGRAMSYLKKTHPHYSEDECREGATQHLKQKYSRGGYVRYPDMYLKVFGDRVDQHRLAIEAL